MYDVDGVDDTKCGIIVTLDDSDFFGYPSVHIHVACLLVYAQSALMRFVAILALNIVTHTQSVDHLFH